MVMLLLIFASLSLLILGFALSKQKERRGTGYNWKRPRDTTGQSLVGTLNHLGGIAVGFVTVCVWIGIGLLIYNFVSSSAWVGMGRPTGERLLHDYQVSTLVPVFRVFLPYVLRTIEPWLPGGLPAMFRALSLSEQSMDKYLETLEYPKILGSPGGIYLFFRGRELAEGLLPSTDLGEVQAAAGDQRGQAPIGRAPGRDDGRRARCASPAAQCECSAWRWTRSTC